MWFDPPRPAHFPWIREGLPTACSQHNRTEVALCDAQGWVTQHEAVFASSPGPLVLRAPNKTSGFPEAACCQGAKLPEDTTWESFVQSSQASVCPAVTKDMWANELLGAPNFQPRGAAAEPKVWSRDKPSLLSHFLTPHPQDPWGGLWLSGTNSLFLPPLVMGACPFEAHLLISCPIWPESLRLGTKIPSSLYPPGPLVLIFHETYT